MSRIENEVKQYQEEILANETKNNLLELKKMQLELLEKRANDEVKLYVSNKVWYFNNILELIKKKYGKIKNIFRPC